MTKPSDIELKRMKTAALIPLFFLLIMFSIRLIESVEGISLGRLGIKPLSLEGLPGILFAPLIHSGWDHFYANAISFLVLGTSLFYFYRGISVKVFFLIYVMTGIWLWLGARDAWHIGASGVIYGLAAFLFVSGVIRNYIPLLAISLMVVFLYGGLIWGIFPLKWDVPYSWEAHLWGSVAGTVLAVVYRKMGPQKPIKEWSEEDEEGDDNPYWEMHSGDIDKER